MALLFTLTDREIERFKTLLDQAHHDQNQGVPIGMRWALLSLAETYSNADEIIARLDLDERAEPQAWAAARCKNPDRLMHGPYIPPPAVPEGTPWVFMMTGDGNKMNPDGTWLPDAVLFPKGPDDDE